MKSSEKHAFEDGPLVSVVVPVFNAEETIGGTLDALRAQTYAHIEFVVVNDGSTDRSLSIIRGKAEGDTRFRIISRENRGLISSLNEAISLSRGKYIAREDADDYSSEDRILRQVEFMESNQRTVVLGSQSKNFGASSALSSYPMSNDDCKARLLFSPPVSHPAVMIRKDFLSSHELSYSQDFQHCEDYALWSDISLHGGEIANLDRVLHFYRVHPGQVSVVNSATTLRNHHRIVRRHLEQLGLHLDEQDLKCLVLADKELFRALGLEQFKKILNIYDSIIRLNNKLEVYAAESLRRLIVERVAYVLQKKLGLSGVVVVFASRAEFKYEVMKVSAVPAAVRSIKSLVKAILFRIPFMKPQE